MFSFCAILPWGFIFMRWMYVCMYVCMYIALVSAPYVVDAKPKFSCQIRGAGSDGSHHRYFFVSDAFTERRYRTIYYLIIRYLIVFLHSRKDMWLRILITSWSRRLSFR